MPRVAREVQASLLRKGFCAKNGDHIYYYLFVDGKKTMVRTKISLGEREITDNLLSVMARQCMLTKSRFNDLLDCPLSHEDYVNLLRESGHVAKTPADANPR